MVVSILALVVLLTDAVRATAVPRATTVYLPGIDNPVTYGVKKYETKWTSSSPDTFVATSIVSLYLPLNSSYPAHDPECDYVSYLRYRHVNGPSDHTKADRVMTFMPGTLAGAGGFDPMAHNIIYEFNKQGLYGEVWSLDRRSTCLEDNTGIQYAVKTKSTKAAIDYYYHNKTINGRRFAGFYGNNDPKLQLLAYLGVDNCIKDWYDIVNTELPDPVYRSTKHFASGHSLGGILAAYFGNYDSDGKNSTTDDAGYNSAAGFIAFDSYVNPSSSPNTSVLGPLGAIIQAIIGVDPVADAGFLLTQGLFLSGAIPRSLFTALPALSTEAANLLSIVGVYANIYGNQEIKVSELAVSSVANASASLFIAANSSVTSDQLFSLRVTGSTLLGSFLGDRTQPIEALRGSFGFPTGAQIVDKAGLFPGPPYGGPSLAAPVDYGPKYGLPGKLYTWLNYNQIAPNGSNVAKTSAGIPYCNATNEVSDIFTLAKGVAEPPLDYTEHYYPTRLTTDPLFASAGSKLAIRSNLHPYGYLKRPIINLVGTEGIAIQLNTPPGDRVLLSGYNHLDVLSASREQTLGRRELCSISAVEFMKTLGSGVI